MCLKLLFRVRKEDEEYILTYKGSGMMAREEHNLALNREAYLHLREKADGNIAEAGLRRIWFPCRGNRR